MATQLTIEDLLPDFPRFLAEVFDRGPALYPGAMAHRHGLLPTSASIDALLEIDALPVDSVRLTRAGRGMPRNSYTRLTRGERVVSVVDAGKVMQLFKSGATLTVNDLHRVSAPARGLMRLLSETFACQSEAAVFVTPAGKAGFAPHADELGVIVIQSEGTKDWRVWPTDHAGPRTDVTFEDGELGEPLLEVTLEPGDVLYLPHGTPHAAAATHEQSVHISLGLRPRGWDEIVGAIVTRLMAAKDLHTFPALTADPATPVVDDLASIMRELADDLASTDPAAVLAALRSDLVRSLAPVAPESLTDMRRLDSCSTNQLFHVETSAVEVIEENDERCRVRVKGVTVTLPKVIVSALATGSQDRASLTCRQIYPDVPVGRAMSMAKQLTRLGALSLVTAKV